MAKLDTRTNDYGLKHLIEKAHRAGLSLEDLAPILREKYPNDIVVLKAKQLDSTRGTLIP